MLSPALIASKKPSNAITDIEKKLGEDTKEDKKILFYRSMHIQFSKNIPELDYKKDLEFKTKIINIKGKHYATHFECSQEGKVFYEGFVDLTLAQYKSFNKMMEGAKKINNPKT